MHKLATEKNLIYDCAIDAADHGQKVVDGQSGIDNGALDKKF